MGTHHGNDGKAKIGSNQVAEVTGIRVTERASVADNSALGDAWDKHLGGPKNWEAEMTCWWDETDTNGQEACSVGASITFGYYPEGDGAGAAYRSGTGTIVEVGHELNRTATVGRTIRVQGNGALTQTTV